ncbi:S-adenosyl-L-methionine-dependent methyltransferase [Tricharina praecox]|uniref:S-adenosyl-L-methionine-dependent methyltransferase n=1 Tax=Tricharina praecox TaxID=43433 RepID=UPI002220FA3C|nr:S-adenosyl-L-methionine-dependent methyltransferase [Tricharina praecox]KAI5857060.1 S-adenosyl-L-methionine-dependent methyltransferase [Tricharina praecox]
MAHSDYEDSDFTAESESMMDIEADSDYDEISSQYDSCYSSGSDNTTTLFSEVTNYKFEHGRRYHAYAEGLYWGPNDDKQNQQLEIFHHIFTMVLEGRLFLSPIEQPKKVLDLGTGTGIWAIEMADFLPNSQILGNDLSPVQPTWLDFPAIPANCTFEIDDFLRPWTHTSGSFDLIYARGLYGCVDEWPQLLSQAYNALAPGGWFESVEVKPYFCTETTPDNKLAEGTILKRWGELAVEASVKSGRPLDIAGNVGGWMKRTGFVNVSEKPFKVPYGPWPKGERMKMIGKLMCVNVLEGLEGFTLALFTRYLGWSAKQYTDFHNLIVTEMRDPHLNLWVLM